MLVWVRCELDVADLKKNPPTKAEEISTDFTFDRGARILPRSAAKIPLAYQNRPFSGLQSANQVD
jgi:hypothetical protein